MDQLNVFPEYAAQWAVAIGILLLLVDVMIFGFATLVLSFLALGFLALGGAIALDIIDSYTGAAAFLAISTGLIAALLWKPLKRMTKHADTKVGRGDFHGLTFKLNAPVDEDSIASHQHSGITWAVGSKYPIDKGTLVEVTDVEVGKFWVEPKM